jgi:hypothetical protein
MRSAPTCSAATCPTGCDHLAHRYFDTAHAILQATIDDDLPDLERAVHALTQSLPNEEPDTDPHLA